jgi:hypothetical protein
MATQGVREWFVRVAAERSLFGSTEVEWVGELVERPRTRIEPYRVVCRRAVPRRALPPRWDIRSSVDGSIA